MKKNVLLIFPSLKKDPRALDPEVYRPPLGILTISGPLLKEGYSVSIIDERVESEFDEILNRELAKQPICVGISSMSGWSIKNALSISKFVKDYTKIPVVWGGVHVSLFPEHVIKNELVDYIVTDDGEVAFLELVQCLDAGELARLKTIKGIGFKETGGVHITEMADPVDIAMTPPVPFELIDFAKYTSHKTREISSRSGLNANHNIPIETSRGCPYSCAFCTESKRKKKWRALPPERVIRDIKHYIKVTGLKGFSITDDNFFGNPKRGKEIIDLLVKENLNISWHTNSTSNFISRQEDAFIMKMQKAGCKLLVFGAESGSSRILKMIQKKATLDDVFTTNKKLAKSKIIPSFICIQGFPTESLEDIKKTYLMNIKLLSDNKNAINSNVFLIPTPGTIIADMVLGDKVKTMGLEGWSQIFDLRMDKKHPWVEEETYDFIRKNRYMFAVFRLANRVPAPLNAVIHFLMWGFKIRIKYGIDFKVDRYILNIIFNNYEKILHILKKIFKINLVGV